MRQIDFDAAIASVASTADFESDINSYQSSSDLPALLSGYVLTENLETLGEFLQILNASEK